MRDTSKQTENIGENCAVVGDVRVTGETRVDTADVDRLHTIHDEDGMRRIAGSRNIGVHRPRYLQRFVVLGDVDGDMLSGFANGIRQLLEHVGIDVRGGQYDVLESSSLAVGEIAKRIRQYPVSHAVRDDGDRLRPGAL